MCLIFISKKQEINALVSGWSYSMEWVIRAFTSIHIPSPPWGWYKIMQLGNRGLLLAAKNSQTDKVCISFWCTSLFFLTVKGSSIPTWGAGRWHCYFLLVCTTATVYCTGLNWIDSQLVLHCSCTPSFMHRSLQLLEVCALLREKRSCLIYSSETWLMEVDLEIEDGQKWSNCDEMEMWVYCERKKNAGIRAMLGLEFGNELERLTHTGFWSFQTVLSNRVLIYLAFWISSVFTHRSTSLNSGKWKRKEVRASIDVHTCLELGFHSYTSHGVGL